MATFKAVIPYQKEDGTARVVIRVTHKRVIRFINTDIYVTKEDLTRSGKIKSEGIQDDVDNLVKKYRDDVRGLGLRTEGMTCDALKDYLTHKGGENAVIDFIAYGRAKVEKMRKEGKGSARNYDSALNSFVRFLKRDTIDINEMTASLMRGYEEYLATTKSAKSETLNIPMKGRGASLYLGSIRKIINDAKNDFNDEDLGIVRVKVSPFAKYKVPKPTVSRKRSLTVEQICLLRDLELRSNLKRANFARDIFMLSFYLVGMNSVDLYTCTTMAKGRIPYNRAKTKDRREDDAEISITVEPEAMVLLEKYKDPTGARVFNFHRMYANEGTFNDAINKGLKQIGGSIGDDDLEFYAARHSWATIAVNDCEVDKYIVHTALNHVDDAMRITDIYIKKDYSMIDRANRKVLDYLLT